MDMFALVAFFIIFSFVGLFMVVVFIETYVLSNPSDRFSVWWRRNVLYHDDENRFD